MSLLLFMKKEVSKMEYFSLHIVNCYQLEEGRSVHQVCHFSLLVSHLKMVLSSEICK